MIGAPTRSSQRYRLRMHPAMRTLRAVLFAAIGVFFLPAAVAPGVDLAWRALAVAGVVSSVVSLRYVLGAAVVVDPDGLRLLSRWPLRRHIPWYRVLENDVMPQTWTLELELVDGEHVDLPCVEHVDRLYAAIEQHRHELGS